jgi:hypothetical protein
MTGAVEHFHLIPPSVTASAHPIRTLRKATTKNQFYIKMLGMDGAEHFDRLHTLKGSHYAAVDPKTRVF